MKKQLKIKWWKWAFLFLLAFNLAFVAVIASRLVQVREPDSKHISNYQEKDVKVGTFVTNRSQLNKTVASFLKDYQSEKISYKLYSSSSSIIFEGKYQLLGYEVPLYIYFQPIGLKDGSIQLQVSSFSAGTLPLPESEVLQYLKSSYQLPSFVEVQPKQSSIIINLRKIENNAGIYLSAKKIDLVNDQISFEIYKK
ncbi:YpmS family protein [Streptococcus catagoni]|uniref:YpmS family protein n=1 Tax=Streptococcus catagoni TaxID=2654874 RepID=UPI00140A6600|nr:DUF2140 family protein [Streptococcus catagoni]